MRESYTLQLPQKELIYLKAKNENIHTHTHLWTPIGFQKIIQKKYLQMRSILGQTDELPDTRKQTPSEHSKARAMSAQPCSYRWQYEARRTNLPPSQSHMVQKWLPSGPPRLCTNTAGQMLVHKREQTLGATVLLPPHAHFEHPVKKLGREITNWHLCLNCFGLKCIQEVRKWHKNIGLEWCLRGQVPITGNSAGISTKEAGALWRPGNKSTSLDVSPLRR